MPIYDKVEIGRAAQQYGFVRDTFEKVIRLKEILRFLNEEDYLREHLLLKGGTAINLTVFDLPRLSVDIDMDYMPNDTKENKTLVLGENKGICQGIFFEYGITIDDDTNEERNGGFGSTN